MEDDSVHLQKNDGKSDSGFDYQTQSAVWIYEESKLVAGNEIKIYVKQTKT